MNWESIGFLNHHPKLCTNTQVHKQRFLASNPKVIKIYKVAAQYRGGMSILLLKMTIMCSQSLQKGGPTKLLELTPENDDNVFAVSTKGWTN